jgi:hypothetical protein
MTTNVLQELGALHLARPAAGASVAEIAAWHERRASVLEHLAIDGAANAREAAESAHRLADWLLIGGLPRQGKGSVLWRQVSAP